MSTLDATKKQSTAVITDIRNFSETFKNFQGKGSDEFLIFLGMYYANQMKLARTIDKNVYQSPIGDGILSVFMGDDHYKHGFAYVIASHKLLNNMCDSFMKQHGGNISFGIGADSGNVWSIGADILKTYVGTVINRAARIESMTKMFANTTTAVGNSLYKSLIKSYFPAAYELMGSSTNYDQLLNLNPEAVLISKHFMLQYIFDMPLRGIQTDAPIFRLSQSLVDDNKLYWSVMDKLLDENTVIKIKELIEEIPVFSIYLNNKV